MTNYIPSNVSRKKAALLERREALLLNELHAFTNPDLLCKFAEQVREAQLGYLKAKRHFAVESTCGELPVGHKIDSEMEGWRRKTADEIIESYRKISAAKTLSNDS